ncbi:hypothetical protein BDW22DRAFT_1352926 [Trametopsis cervina]|nr:hypothetical protein BDW22DRAFT_1352926 [Trametopsis cervina]
MKVAHVCAFLWYTTVCNVAVAVSMMVALPQQAAMLCSSIPLCNPFCTLRTLKAFLATLEAHFARGCTDLVQARLALAETA